LKKKIEILRQKEMSLRDGIDKLEDKMNNYLKRRTYSEEDLRKRM